MTDDRMDQIIGKLLRVGVILAALNSVRGQGVLWYLGTAGEVPVAYRPFRPDVHGLHALMTLPHPQALVLLGLLILISTPVARVIFSLVVFATEGDRLYVGFTLAVLAILLYSLGTAWL